MAKPMPERPDTVRPHLPPTSIPLAAWGGIAAGYAALVWIAILEPGIASIGVEWRGSSQFVVGIAISVGALLGVRTLWGIYVFLTALTTVFTGIAMVDDPIAQTIGGTVLGAVSVVLLLLPSVQRYATGRLRMFVERDTDRGSVYSAIPRLLGVLVVTLLIVWWALPEYPR